jgi:hypothetical protein
MTNLFYTFTKEKAPMYFPGVSFAAAALLVLLASMIIFKELKKRNA